MDDIVFSEWHVLLIKKGHPLLPRSKLAEMIFVSTAHINCNFSVLKIIDGLLAPSAGRKQCARGHLVGLWSLELSTATE